MERNAYPSVFFKIDLQRFNNPIILNFSISDGSKPHATPVTPTVEKVDILGRLFTQSSTQSEEERIRKEQEQFDKQNKEKTEENEKSWRRMKIG